MPRHLPLSILPALVLCGVPASAQDGAPALPGASVSVDSTFPGYSSGVLADGKWIAPGQETTQDTGSPDRLGNCGNTWVSSATEGVEHWVRLDWPAAVEVGRVTVWWAGDPWFPQAFRIETLSDESWVPVTAVGKWFSATERRSVFTFASLRTRALRVLQHPNGSGERGLMACQEVSAFAPAGSEPGVEGARELSNEELRAIEPLELERNIARLHLRQPGSVDAVAWEDRQIRELPGLNDEDLRTPVEAETCGFVWPIQHVIDGVTLHFRNSLPAADAVAFLAGNGEDWFVPDGLRLETSAEVSELRLRFEPTACDRVRFSGLGGLSEAQVHRYIPPDPHTWPERLVKDNLLEKELLASGREASYEQLCRYALSMRPAHALLGLKDAPSEVGVTWDGKLISDRPLSFAFGEHKEGLERYPDTVRRVLIDGWLPATVVTGQMGDLQIAQTAFISFAAAGREAPALFSRIELHNQGDAALDLPLWVTVRCPSPAGLTFADGRLLEGDRCVLAVLGGAGEHAGNGGVRIDVHLAAGATATVDLAQPHDVGRGLAEPAAYSAARFDVALADLRAYWSELLAPAMELSLPEERLNRMYKAVLTQVFINADGDVMPYGSAPSVYDGNLYGVEESFAMLALAFCGFGDDAQRYLDGTYLTPEFLKKVDEYKVYADRHQQYRNGLQPHYAVSAYRFTRDDAWIRRHLPLLRDCAEWTLQQRRRTMVEEGGEKPLHWGLLPKWSYGGDISELQCYALYANFACWRGMRDTGWLLGELGDTEGETRYLSEAEAYRQVLDSVVAASYRRDHEPPFLPLRLYADEPVGNDYYQLFAGVLLDLMPFALDGEALGTITDYLEEANLTFCRMARFRRDVGPGGLDGLYGLGYVLTRLHQDRIDEFLLGLYGYLAFNMDRGTFASRETNLIYSSDLHVRSKYKVPDMSDPIPCSAAVALHYLRNALVSEEIGGPGLPTGDLLLLAGAPRAWFADGQKIEVRGAPTHFGEVSLHVHSDVAAGRITARVVPPERDPWGAIKLRLRHPEGKRMVAVEVNGEKWIQVDAEREMVLLKPGAQAYEVVVQYR